MTSASGTWQVSWCRGTVAELHAGSADEVAGPGSVNRLARVHQPSDAAVVLGSGQAATDIDTAAARARGFDVVRRRSGGGAVLVSAANVMWVDVVVPAADSLWIADVGRAAWWLGEVWADALVALGVPGGGGLAGPVVHRGRFERRAWSEWVCFAGLGPGEVTVGGRKVVGIAQRRTRAGALFQCAAALSWRPEELVDVLALSAEERRRALDAVAEAGYGIGAARAQPLLASFLDQLGRR